MTIKIKQLLLHCVGCLIFIAFPILSAPHPHISWDMLRNDIAQRDFATYIPMIIFFYFNYYFLIPTFYFPKRYVPYLITTVLCLLLITFLTLLIRDNHKPPFNNNEFNNTNKPPFNNNEFNNNNKPPFNNNELNNANKPQLNDNEFNNTHKPQLNDNEFNNTNSENRPPQYKGDFHDKFNNKYIDFFEFSHILFLFLSVLFISLSLRINKQLKQTEEDKLNAELSYLKAQINPHFLFNTLNSIYSLAITENANQTSNAIVKLSGMMRYVISEANKDFVPLEKEINYLKDYIEMQKLRLGDTVKIDPSVNGAYVNKKIAPLMLISFIENTFKHGVNPEVNSIILIKLDVVDNDLTLIVKNNKVNTLINGLNKSGIGIDNTKNRLALLYPDKHELMINDNEKEYTVLLKINLA